MKLQAPTAAAQLLDHEAAFPVHDDDVQVLGSSDLSMTSVSPASMPRSRIESPSAVAKKVATGLPITRC